jgi:DNA-binding transcriptional ArsR family regulator
MKLNAAVSMLSGLAQDTRLHIFRLLVQAGPHGSCVGEIVKALDIAPATLSFHLAHLRHAGLVTMEAAGRNKIYRADYTAMNALLGYLTENCCGGTDVCAGSGASMHLQGEIRDEAVARTRRRARSG